MVSGRLNRHGAALSAAVFVVSLACSAAGTGAPPATAPRAQPSGPPRAVDLAWGRDFCAVRSDGRVVCWGSDGGALGDGSREARSTARVVPGLDGITEIRGFPFGGACALRSDRSLWCWGFGDEYGSARLAPTRVLDDVVDYAFTEAHNASGPGVCARRMQAGVSCAQFEVDRAKPACAAWGDDGRQACIANEFPVRVVPTPIPDHAPLVFGEPDDLPPATTYHRACALFGGEVRCRGSNDQGQLGDPARPDSAEFLPVQGLSDVLSMASFPHSTCVVRAGGQVLCWGRNYGDLKIPPDREDCLAAGSGGIKQPCTRRPTAVPIPDASQVVYRGGSPSYLTRAGEVLLDCPLWSEQKTACSKDRFYRAEGLPPLTRIQRGQRALCGLDRAGAVFCYGYGSELGDGTPLIDRAPAQIPELTGVRAVRVQGHGGACALLVDGRVSCWGTDEGPRGLTNVAALGDGCVLAGDGRVWCWGSNGDGEMGLGRQFRPNLRRADGTFDPSISATPLPVPRLNGTTALATDMSRRCALDGAGALRCWGLLLPGGKYQTWSAAKLADPPPLQAVHLAGGIEIFALARDGSIWSIQTDYTVGRKTGAVAARTDLGPALMLPTHGTDADAQTSTGKTILCWVAPDRSARCAGTPGPIQIGGPIVQLSVSKGRGCAVREDGRLLCWGRPYCAENDKTICRGDVWNHVESILDQVAQVSVGDAYSCAVRTGGTVWCWGSPTVIPRAWHAPRVSQVNIDPR